MKPFILSGENLAKSYDLIHEVFSGLNIQLQNREILGITGHNGSGKSTLLKILCSIVKPSKGSLTLLLDNNKVENHSIHQHIGFVSPYLQLYEEFTAIEHLSLLAGIRGINFDYTYCSSLLEQFGLANHSHSPLKTFSTGMKQRFKFVMALQHKPLILALDEPSSNIDESGVQAIKQAVAEQIDCKGAVIIASNDKRETDLCEKTVSLYNNNELIT